MNLKEGVNLNYETLASKTRRKCFISYHHDDEIEVQRFIEVFDHNQDVLIARGIGASMAGDSLIVAMRPTSNRGFARSICGTPL